MSVQDRLLNSVLLAECVVDVRHLKSAWVLVDRVERVEASRRHRTLLQAVWARSKNVGSLICLQEAAALPRVEVAESLRAALAAVNVGSLQGGGLEIRVLSLGRQHLRVRAEDWPNLAQEVVLVTVLVHGGERVRDTAGFENLMSDVAIVQLRALERALPLAHDVPGFRLAAVDAADSEDVSRCQVSVLVLHGPGTFNVINILLVTQEARRLRLDECDALHFVVRVQRISRHPGRSEFDALRLGKKNVVRLHLVVWLVGETDVQLARHRPLDVRVRQVPLRLGALSKL